jgi:betaine reductase
MPEPTSTDAVITASTQILAHVPGLTEHGSKPRRELPRSEEVAADFHAALRSYDDAVAYGPHQAYLNALHPRDLPPRPWVGAGLDGASRFTPAGEIMPEDEFLGLMAVVDDFGLLTLSEETADRAGTALAGHPLAKRLDLDRLDKAKGNVEGVGAEPGATLIGDPDHGYRAVMRWGEGFDESLASVVLLDNLAAKATATLALLHLLDKTDVDPLSIPYVLGCGEEAIGDRYQRGGGNMGKTVAEKGGLLQASGADIKNFCAAPVPALVMAAALVSSGVFERVAVIAGGSMAKLGMKFQGHLKHDLPVLEDVLGGTAALVERAGVSAGRTGPRIRLDAVGRHTVAAGGAQAQVMQALALEPLARLGLPFSSIDDFATELHNPEITEPQGSGNVPERNYRTIAALAVKAGDIERADIADFVLQHGMPGYAPTQGHLASSLCYLPHAVERLTSGSAERVMLIAKGSLFLGRMSQLSDGMSVLLERSP